VNSHSAGVEAAPGWSTEIMRRAGSLALLFRQPRALKLGGQLGPVAAPRLQPAPCATAVATLVPQSVTNGSSSKSDEAWGVSGTAAAVLAAASCGATAQAMDKDNNLQTERLDDSSLSETHSTAASQQAQTAWSSFWAQRVRSKAAEFVTRLGELRQRQKQVRKDARAAGGKVRIAEVPEALKQQQAKKEETAKGYFERVYKEGQELTTLKPVTVGDIVLNHYQVAKADLPTDDEAAVMQEVVLKKYVIQDTLIQRRKIPSDAATLVSVEGRPCPEFLFLPKAFSHKAYCATHRVPLYFGAFTPHAQVASWKLAYLIC
jgi:hypothetical protein